MRSGRVVRATRTVVVRFVRRFRCVRRRAVGGHPRETKGRRSVRSRPASIDGVCNSHQQGCVSFGTLRGARAPVSCGFTLETRGFGSAPTDGVDARGDTPARVARAPLRPEMRDRPGRRLIAVVDSKQGGLRRSAPDVSGAHRREQPPHVVRLPWNKWCELATNSRSLHSKRGGSAPELAPVETRRLSRIPPNGAPSTRPTTPASTSDSDTPPSSLRTSKTAVAGCSRSQFSRWVLLESVRPLGALGVSSAAGCSRSQFGGWVLSESVQSIMMSSSVTVASTSAPGCISSW